MCNSFGIAIIIILFLAFILFNSVYFSVVSGNSQDFLFYITKNSSLEKTAKPSIIYANISLGVKDSKAELLIRAQVYSQSDINQSKAIIEGPSPESNRIGAINLFRLEDFDALPINSEVEGGNGTWFGQFPLTTTRLDAGGTYKVIVKFTDESGMSDSYEARLNFDEVPKITITAPSTVTASQAKYGANVTYLANGSLGSGAPFKPFCYPNSGSIFPVGYNVIKCSIIEKNGNFNEKTVAVRVLTSNTTNELSEQPMSLVSNKKIFNRGEYAYFTANLTNSTRSTMRIIDPSGAVYRETTTLPLSDKPISFPFYINESAVPGKWHTSFVDGNNVTRNTEFYVNDSKPTKTISPHGQVVFKNEGDSTVASIKNNGNIDIYSFLISTKVGNIQSVKVDGWNFSKVSNTTFTISSNKGLKQNNSLMVYMKNDRLMPLPSVISSDFDSRDHGNSPFVIISSSANPFTKCGVLVTTEKCHTIGIQFLGDGSGRVLKDSNPNLACTASCSWSVSQSKQLVVFAEADGGSWFEGWGGPCASAITYGRQYVFFNTLDTDIVCTVSFKRANVLTVRPIGSGIGEVTSDPPGIKCGTWLTGSCTYGFSASQIVRLTSTAASVSNFDGWGLNCNQATNTGQARTIEIQLDTDKECSAKFDPESGTRPTTATVAIPEFIDISRVLKDRQDINIGWPIGRSVTPPPGESRESVYGLSEFQLFREDDNPYFNSGEMYRDTEGNLCISVAYSSSRGPAWYDSFWARNGVEEGWKFRRWANDERSLGNIMHDNKNPSGWLNILPSDSPTPYKPNGPSLPPGRAPAAHWFTQCTDNNGRITSDIPSPTIPSITFGPYCKFDQVTELHNNVNPFSTGAPAEWATVHELPGVIGVDRSVFSAPLWQPTAVTGVLTNSFLAGTDAEPTHQDWPEGYWKGLDWGFPPPIQVNSLTTTLGAPMPYFPLRGSNNCEGPFRAIFALCNDWDMHLLPDPEHRSRTELFGLNSNRFDDAWWRWLNFGGRDLTNPLDLELIPPPSRADPQFWDTNINDNNIELENEQWLIPQGYRPDVGDRILTIGRLAADCGHDWHSEIHPMELILSSYTQVGRLDPIVDSVFDWDTGLLTFFPDTLNLPAITSMWDQLTERSPATVSRLVVTGAWRGEELSFDLWPPPRPSIDSRLHFWHENKLLLGSGLRIETIPLPPNNPNHLHVRISTDPSQPPDLFTVTAAGEVKYNNFRRIVDAYMLWW